MIGKKTNGYDCLVIPGAEKAADGIAAKGTKQCGRSKGVFTVDGGTHGTVCSKYSCFISYTIYVQITS